ncbi:uracil-DNA glycosylase-like protein [Gottschalkia acidurici 9a]|uniref:Uracil-DNA glycosylase-like protein n=1 Tax=Gottschalkia acidurici (strain ATCC 7906 / DSM 604 / BCRC 14475 / CIP 104303 / KCTC 5404 / NCIMB 10678 / 9a) TaxID=1128398 RepID=K0AYX9_GOTA9|nr:DNA-deoxyinosine glycosylase [Gottschalkia acidurici]AFS78459.1 uracil-DNA glycosylase-like protein [Gottschalkia acidurici 9a]
MNNIKSLRPIVNDTSKVLILGSIPGKESLEKQKYYANPRNSFWKIIFSLYDLNVEEHYNKKIEFLQEKNIAIWDVIKTCDRRGSLDSNIKNEEANDFSTLFKYYPNIRFVLFNGAKSYDVFSKQVGFDISSNITFRKLNSSSPANTIPFEVKLNEWKVIKEYLEQED